VTTRKEASQKERSDDSFCDVESIAGGQKISDAMNDLLYHVFSVLSTLFRKKAVLPKSAPLCSEENQQKNHRCNRPTEQSTQCEEYTSAAPPFPTAHRMIFSAAFIQNPICRSKQVGLGTAAPIIRPKHKVCLFKIWIFGRSQNHRANLNSFDHSFSVPFLFRIAIFSFRNRAEGSTALFFSDYSHLKTA
jgi:hypothetical protein